MVAFVTSLSRSIKFCENKLKALRLLKTLAANSEAGVVLDRILPYLVSDFLKSGFLGQERKPSSLQLYFLHDPYARVRAEAVHTVAHVLALVDALPKRYVYLRTVSWGVRRGHRLMGVPDPRSLPLYVSTLRLVNLPDAQSNYRPSVSVICGSSPSTSCQPCNTWSTIHAHSYASH